MALDTVSCLMYIAQCIERGVIIKLCWVDLRSLMLLWR